MVTVMCPCCMQVCLSVVGVLGDLCRNVEEDILPYCDEVMQLLIHNLGSNDVHRTIKPQVSKQGTQHAVPAIGHLCWRCWSLCITCLWCQTRLLQIWCWSGLRSSPIGDEPPEPPTETGWFLLCCRSCPPLVTCASCWVTSLRSTWTR